MQVTEALVDKIANLARLEFNDSEKAEIRHDLQRMIAFVEKLKEIDTTGVEPLIHMSDEVNILREDLVKGQVSHEEALRNSPAHFGDFFIVPKVIQKKSGKI